MYIYIYIYICVCVCVCVCVYTYIHIQTYTHMFRLTRVGGLPAHSARGLAFTRYHYDQYYMVV